MKISDLFALAARNLARRKGRTALTVIGVAVGTCLIIVMISFGLAMNQANEEMLASWGDLTQIEVYGGGMTVAYSSGGVMIGGSGPDEPAKLDDAMIDDFRKMDHVVTATPFYQPYSLNGTITAGNNGRYSTGLSNMVGVYSDALSEMGFTLASGDWLSDTGNYGRDVIPVLVCEQTGYNFEDTRKSYRSQNRYRWYGQTDAMGNLLPPFVDVLKDDMTLTLSNGDTENPKEKSYQLKVVGSIVPDTSKGWWTQSSFIMRIQDLKALTKEYEELADVGDRQQRQHLRHRLREGGRHGQCGGCGRGHPGPGLLHLLDDPAAGGHAGAGHPADADPGLSGRLQPAGGGAEHHQHHDHGHLRAHPGDRHHEGAGLRFGQDPLHVPDRVRLYRPDRRRGGGWRSAWR